jgi:hypothetical protein
MQKIGKIIAFVVVGILVSVNFAVVTYFNVNDDPFESPTVFVQDKNGNLAGDFTLESRSDGKYDLIIESWDDETTILIYGLKEVPKDLLIKFDHYDDDPMITYAVYVDSMEFSRAQITIPRENSVSEILYSPDFDSFHFSSNEWKDPGISHWEDEGTVTFEVDHFSAYGVVEELSRYTVTTTADSGEGSLRQAILDANSDFGTDYIDFDIPSSDMHHYYYKDDGIDNQVSYELRERTTMTRDYLISDIDVDYPNSFFSTELKSELPIISDPVIIDGFSQGNTKENTLLQGNNAILKIELNGAGSGWYPGGLNVKAGSSTIRGLAISGFGLCGIQIDTRNNNVIEGNYIGTDISGMIAQGNFIGVNIFNSSGNLVGGDLPSTKNVILGNKLLGVFISGVHAENNVVKGNYISTPETESTDLANGAKGVWIADKIEGENTIGENVNAEDINPRNFRHLTILDASVPNYYTLLRALVSDEDIPSLAYPSDTEVIILDIHSDGITQITDLLKEYEDITTLHIISHGDVASLSLGSTEVNTNTLSDYSELLGQWALSFTENTDIMIYGCNVGSGEEGMDFLKDLKELTGADIAASNDPTGSSDLGGDWDLEVELGIIESQMPFDLAALEEYNHLLGNQTYYDYNLSSYTGAPRISPHTKDAIVNGLSELADVLGDIVTSNDMSESFMEAVPGLLDISDPNNPVAPGMGELPGGYTLRNLFQGLVVDEINLNFSAHNSLNALVNFIKTLNTSVGIMTITVDGVSGSLTHNGGDDYEFEIDLTFSVEYEQTYKFDLGRNADVIGFSYKPEDMPSVDLKTGFSLDLSFGVEVILTEGDYDMQNDTNDTAVITENSEFFIRDTSLDASAEVSETGLAFDLQIGFLEIEVFSGTHTVFGETMALFVDPGSDPLTLSELTSTPVSNLIDVSSNGTIFSNMPVKVKDILTTGFNTTFESLALSIQMLGDPFNPFVAPGGDDPRSAPPIDMSLDFKSHILPFTLVLADGLLGLLEQLKGWYGSFGTSQMFSVVDVPFADGETLASALDLLSGLDDLLTNSYIAITDEDGLTTPQFISVQTLAIALDNALTSMNLSTINTNYDLTRNELTFTISLNPSLSTLVDIPIDFNVDLGVMGGITTDVNVSVVPDISFQLTFGIDLRPEAEIGISTRLCDIALRSLMNKTTGQAHTPTNGQLPQDAKFKLTLGGLGSVLVNVSTANTSGNSDINDLAADIELAINTELVASEIDDTIEVDVLIGNRLIFISDNSTYLRIQNNSDNDAQSKGGFELLGFWDGQVGSTTPTPINGILSGEATFDITVGTIKRSVSVPQDTSNANISGPTDKDPKIDRLIFDLQVGVNNALNGSNIVDVRRIGDGFAFVLGSATIEKYLRVQNPNDVASVELGIPEDQIAAELQIIGDRYLYIIGNVLSNDIETNFNIDEDVSITLEIDGEEVTFMVRAANGNVIGFCCNQGATGTLTANEELNDAYGPKPEVDITFMLTMEDTYYIQCIWECGNSRWYHG